MHCYSPGIKKQSEQWAAKEKSALKDQSPTQHDTVRLLFGNLYFFVKTNTVKEKNVSKEEIEDDNVG